MNFQLPTLVPLAIVHIGIFVPLLPNQKGNWLKKDIKYNIIVLLNINFIPKPILYVFREATTNFAIGPVHGGN